MMTATSLPVRTLPRLAEAGGVVICLASGPSLTASDVELCRGKGIVVCVNDAYRFAPWADVLYSSDRYWWQHYRGVPEFHGLKATIEYTPGRYAAALLTMVPDLVVFRHTGHLGIEWAPDGLRTCGQNSGGAAVNLAVHLGARRIVLLGYDLGRGTDGKTHFFGDHPPPLNGRQDFVHWRRCFEEMVAPLEELGVEVVNCSRRTSLNAFACRPLEEVIA